jgi:hypothetical protein
VRDLGDRGAPPSLLPSRSQQDCPDGLGHDGQGRSLQGARRARGAIAPDIRRDVTVGRANST